MVSEECLYPALEPYRSDRLAVGDGTHRLYFEQSGNPEGLPVIFLHGGPGSGTSPRQRRFFDPARYRIILLDQRGAGRSEPAGSLEGNTTQALIGDLERLREHLGIERWLVYGGSWGAALALVYAREHPDTILGLVLRGVFLARLRDVAWMFGHDGAGRLFPEAYAQFIDYLPPEQRSDPVAAYHALLHDPAESKRLEAAQHWNAWESRVIRQFREPEPELSEPDAAPQAVHRSVAILCHYARNAFFLGPDGVALDFERLRGKPCVMIHGRRDLVCPLECAWTAHRAWPGSELRVIEGGGHVASEPVMTEALVKCFDEMASRLGA